MNTTNNRLVGIVGALLICLFAISTASAYNTDIACQSLKEVIAEGSDLTALELIAEYSDGSVTTMKLWTEDMVGPDEILSGRLQHTLEKGTEGGNLSQVVLTLVADEKRTSYTLSPEKSIFIKLPEPVEFPDLSTLKKNLNLTVSYKEDGVKLDYGPFHDFDYSLNGNSLTFWAESWTSPSTTLPLMAAETSIKKWNGLRWTDWAYTGNTLYSTDSVMAHNFNDPVYIQAGSYYKQFAHFEGYKADYSWYEADGEGSQFTL